MATLNTDEEEEALQDRIGEFGDAVGLATDLVDELNLVRDAYDFTNEVTDLHGDLNSIESCEKMSDVEACFASAKKTSASLLESLKKARAEAKKEKDMESFEKLDEAHGTLKSLIRELNQL